MARLYSNENFRLSVVEKLRELGHDVLTSYRAGQANQRISDDQVLIFATQQNRTVLTFNRKDFIKLHRADPNHAGIVICREDTDSMALAERIDVVLRENPELVGQLIRVNRPQLST